MKYLTLISLFLISISAYAELIQLDINLKMKNSHGKTTTISNIIKSKIGEETFISNEKYRIQIIPERFQGNTVTGIQKKETIDLKTKIYEKKRGEFKLVSSPRIISLIGLDSKINMENQRGETLELKIMPTRLTKM